MAFWKVAGFTQPSPIESILDKEEFTLEELLDEDDIIQECKSLNGRLITFLRERKTVEQLLRYLIEPPNDPDDPKKQYRYPFTACEVFCCEVEAVFNTLLEDEELLQLLFSLLEQEPPLSCKSAGYFGRVVGQLLLRKTNEMMQYLSNNEAILEKLIKHVDTTSIADIIKRLVGADDHSSMIFLPMHTQWLSETPLIDLLLERLAPQYSTHVQSNAADILTAIAHTQPSALATQLMQQQSIAALFSRALAPDSRVLVTALDVCAALLEPRRAQQEPSPDGASPMASTAGGNSQSYTEAVTGMLQYLPQLMEHMKEPQGDAAEAQQETPYGILAPPLGRARLRIVELLAALLRVGDDSVDAAIIGAGALPLVQQLFVAYPFNNLLHHQMYALLFAALQRSNAALVEYVFGECALVSWLANIPKEVNPKPRPGFEGRAPLRAGYLGHITRLGQVLQEFAAQQQDIAAVLKDNSEWESFVQQDLMPRLEIEDITHWQCGRPINAEGGELDSDGDEFQNGMDALEQIQGVPPGMYHRYGVLDDMDDDEDEASDHVGDFTNSGPYNADMLVAGMAGLGMDDSEAVQPHAVPSPGASGSGAAEATGADGGASISNWSLLAHPGTSSSAVDIPGERSMEDDAVLLADDDEMGALTASALQSSPPVGSPSPVGPSAPTPMDDSEMVMVEEVDAAVSTSPQPAAQPDVAPATAPNIPSESPASALHVHQQDSFPASAEVPAADQKTAAMANPFVAAAGGSSVSEPSTADAGMSQATVAAAAEMDQHNGVVDPAVDSRQDVCVRDRNYWPGLSHPVQVADEVV